MLKPFSKFMKHEKAIPEMMALPCFSIACNKKKCCKKYKKGKRCKDCPKKD
jgi:hypothetical protein